MFTCVCCEDELLAVAYSMCVCCWVVMENDVGLDTGHELFRLYVVRFEEKGFDVSASCCGHFPVGELVCVPKEK